MENTPHTLACRRARLRARVFRFSTTKGNCMLQKQTNTRCMQTKLSLLSLLPPRVNRLRAHRGPLRRRIVEVCSINNRRLTTSCVTIVTHTQNEAVVFMRAYTHGQLAWNP